MTPEDDRILDEATDWLLMLGETPDDRAVQACFQHWLTADPRHDTVWRELNHSYDIIGQTRTDSTASPPADAPRWRIASVAMAMAAALTVALFAPEALVALRADYRTGTGQITTVTLADGSTARLGPDSAIGIHYAQGERSIDLLSGEALFQVHPDPAHPFRVHAGTVTTTVLGTGFDVRRLSRITQVGVQHGRVRVDNGEGTPSHILTAGDQIDIDGLGYAHRDHTAPALIAAWALGEVNARDRTVAEVIDDIRPWYRGKIIVMDDAMARRRVNGVYNARDAAQAVTSIGTSLGGKVTRITPWLMLIGSR